jgi:hypothetical protein
MGTPNEIAEGIGLGREYYWKRSDGWQIFDQPENWWEWYVEIDGFNGGGGLWITEYLRWHSGGTHSTQPRTLSREESLKLVRELQANLPQLEQVPV